MKNQQQLNQDLCHAIHNLSRGHNKDALLRQANIALEAGANPNAVFGKSPLLHWAAELEFPEAVDLLLHYGANINRRDSDGKTATDKANERRTPAGNQIARRIFHTNELFEAVEQGNVAAAQSAIENGAYVNARHYRNLASPLHRAAFHDNAPMAELLMENGANLWQQNRQGNAPFQIAHSRGHNAISDRLYHTSRLFSAIGTNNIAEAQDAIDNGAKLNAYDKDLSTPLNYARHEGNGAMISLIDNALRAQPNRAAPPIDLSKPPVEEEQPHVTRQQVLRKLMDREDKWESRKRWFNNTGNIISSDTRKSHMENVKDHSRGFGKVAGKVVGASVGFVGGVIGGAAVGSAIFPGPGTVIGAIGGAILLTPVGYKVGGPVGKAVTPHVLKGGVWLVENTVNLIPKSIAQLGRGISYLEEKAYSRAYAKVHDKLPDADLTEFVVEKRTERDQLKQEAQIHRQDKHAAKHTAEQAKHVALKTNAALTLADTDIVKDAKKALDSLVESIEKKDRKAYKTMLRDFDPRTDNWANHVLETAGQFLESTQSKTVQKNLEKANTAVQNVDNDLNSVYMQQALNHVFGSKMNVKRLRTLQHDDEKGSHAAKQDKRRAQAAIAVVVR